MAKRESHGMYKTKLYQCWKNMKGRCNNPNATGYEWYGQRGIKVCKEWNESFVAFMEWAYKNGYKEGLEIDRIDVDGNYEPSNCRWITRKEQMRNTSQNRHITIDGKTKTAREWSEETGIDERVIGWRHRNGYKGREIISKEKGQRKKSAKINGVTKTLLEWSELTGIDEKTIYSRYNKGWRGQKLIKPVAKSKYRGVRRTKLKSGKYSYRATIIVKGKSKNLGTFSTGEEAAKAYNKAAIKYFGESAKLNKIAGTGQ